MPRHTKVLLEGRPGVGKTTIVSRLVELLGDSGIPLTRFMTKEIREGGRRVGFDIEDLSGNRAVLAHVDISSNIRVGRYKVDLQAFERIAIPILKTAPIEGIVVIDELGKMELASEAFREAVAMLFDRNSTIVATVHAFRNAVTDKLKERADVDVIRVDPQNRDGLPTDLFALVTGRQTSKGN